MLSSSLDNLKSSCDKEILVVEGILKIASGETYYSLEHRSFQRISFLLLCVILKPMFIIAASNLMLQNWSYCRYLNAQSEITSLLSASYIY